MGLINSYSTWVLCSFVSSLLGSYLICIENTVQSWQMPSANWLAGSRRTLRFYMERFSSSNGLRFAPASTMASLGRSFAPRLSRDLLKCRQCLGNSNIAARTSFRGQFTGLSFAQTARRNEFSKQFLSLSPKRPFSSSRIVRAVAEEAPKTKTSRFPQVSDKSVAYWLLGSAVSVFGIVVFGGLTRLTESG